MHGTKAHENEEPLNHDEVEREKLVSSYIWLLQVLIVKSCLEMRDKVV